jgi:hypothetical protein
VVRLKHYNGNAGQEETWCSGVPVAPDKVLTEGNCGLMARGTDVSVDGDGVNGGYAESAVASVWVDPSFRAAGTFTYDGAGCGARVLEGGAGLVGAGGAGQVADGAAVAAVDAAGRPAFAAEVDAFLDPPGGATSYRSVGTVSYDWPASQRTVRAEHRVGQVEERVRPLGEAVAELNTKVGQRVQRSFHGTCAGETLHSGRPSRDVARHLEA